MLRIMKMRNKILIVLCSVVLAGCSQYKVYSVKDSPSLRVGGGAVYALPKTQLCVAMPVVRRDLSAAPYFQYAADYLGVDPLLIDTCYRLTGIDVEGVNVADPDNYYYVKVNRGTVSVDKRHLLLAIGAEPVVEENGEPKAESVERKADSGARKAGSGAPATASYNLYDRVDTFYTRYDQPGRPSMLSSRKDVRSVKQRAAAAAERLEEIQSKQQELIDGEYSGTYGADAVEYLFAQLKQQEEQIVSLFCGQLKCETVRFYVDPQMRRNEDMCDTLIWFSPEVGFVGDVEHLPADAFPVVCLVRNGHDLRSASRFVKYHTSGFTTNGSSGRTGSAAAKYRSRKGFRYRIPVTTSVEVTTPVFSVSRQVPMSQLGPVVELPNRRIKAVFDPKTLDLLKLDRR